jgi:hypothetical protein
MTSQEKYQVNNSKNISLKQNFFYKKYLLYKTKYLKLKNMYGGDFCTICKQNPCICPSLSQKITKLRTMIKEQEKEIEASKAAQGNTGDKSYELKKKQNEDKKEAELKELKRQLNESIAASSTPPAIPPATASSTATSSTPPATASSTPSTTASSTPSTTASSAPPATASSTPSTTASSTPPATASSTPSATASSTPSTTASSTPSTTASSTPSTTASSTPSTTASSTPSTTASSAPPATPPATPPAISSSTTPVIASSAAPPPLFDLYEVSMDKILYHGSLYKITTSLFTPAFFSEDITQALGHVLVEYNNFTKGNTYFEMVSLSRKVSKTCYPFIHIFKPNQKLIFLKFNFAHIPSIYDTIYNIPILTEYICRLTPEKRISLLETHLTKMNNINQNKSNYKVQSDNMNVIKENITNILTQYINACKRSCFMGWTDTPGLLLLSGIDYHNYFKEIKIIDADVNIDGFYIPQDQDELILFNTELVDRVDSLYILPYSFIDKKKEDKIEFIQNYMKFKDEYNKNNLNLQFLNIIKEFNIFDKNTWNFNWYRSGCKDFNPLTNIEETCSKCSRYFQKLEDHLYLSYNWKNNDCGKGLSFKLQLEFMSEENIVKLKKYIDFIKTANNNGNIDLWEEICNSSVSESETHRKY